MSKTRIVETDEYIYKVRGSRFRAFSKSHGWWATWSDLGAPFPVELRVAEASSAMVTIAESFRDLGTVATKATEEFTAAAKAVQVLESEPKDGRSLDHREALTFYLYRVPKKVLAEVYARAYPGERVPDDIHRAIRHIASNHDVLDLGGVIDLSNMMKSGLLNLCVTFGVTGVSARDTKPTLVNAVAKFFPSDLLAGGAE